MHDRRLLTNMVAFFSSPKPPHEGFWVIEAREPCFYDSGVRSLLFAARVRCLLFSCLEGGHIESASASCGFPLRIRIRSGNPVRWILAVTWPSSESTKLNRTPSGNDNVHAHYHFRCGCASEADILSRRLRHRMNRLHPTVRCDRMSAQYAHPQRKL